MEQPKEEFFLHNPRASSQPNHDHAKSSLLEHPWDDTGAIMLAVLKENPGNMEITLQQGLILVYHTA